jgi:hypothetical protein
MHPEQAKQFPQVRCKSSIKNVVEQWAQVTRVFSLSESVWAAPSVISGKQFSVFERVDSIA